MKIDTLAPRDKPSMGGDIHACPLRGHWTSFQLVDELGDGNPYGGLLYEITDYENTVYTGKLDAYGVGKVENHFCGPVTLKISEPYQGTEKPYGALQTRDNYPLPITELQVRAEQTRFLAKTGVRTDANPAQGRADPGAFYQIEVSELVMHVAHLPPIAPRNNAPSPTLHRLFRRPTGSAKSATPKNTLIEERRAPVDTTEMAMDKLGFGPPSKPVGIALLPNKHHVLEVRPMRALRPILSTNDEFCALNLYQLALMSTLSYSDFGQDPNTQPVETDTVQFPLQPSSGNWFGHALPQFDEIWKVDAQQTTKHYPLYEEVPYSRRLEVVPFDPHLYPKANNPNLGDEQENPAKLHFFDDRLIEKNSDTQAFITHHDEVILICVRGTQEGPDNVRDIDARQVPFEEGVGRVHNGFYVAAKAAYKFVVRYLENFYNGQKLIITGHSLGGAISLLLAEMLRRDKQFSPEIVLYTYGAPRAADTTFIEAASELVHHRIVNHNDPVPSVPSTWMNTPSLAGYGSHVTVLALHPAAGLAYFAAGISNWTGEPYGHHGQLRHFMPVLFDEGVKSSILWEPGCSTISDHGCAETLRQVDGLPQRASFLHQIFSFSNHYMTNYIPACWASLRRWQEALQHKRSLVTPREFDWVSDALKSIERQLNEHYRHIDSVARTYAHPQRDEQLKRDLEQETFKLRQARDRLQALHYQTVTAANVYGSHALQPEGLEDSLRRWTAHAENRVEEQLAMMPPVYMDPDSAIAELMGGYVIGAPMTLDFDSLI